MLCVILIIMHFVHKVQINGEFSFGGWVRRKIIFFSIKIIISSYSEEKSTFEPVVGIVCENGLL